MRSIVFFCLFILPGIAFGKSEIRLDTVTIDLIVKDKASTYTVTVTLNQRTQAREFTSHVWPFVEISQHGQIGNVKVDNIQAEPPYLKSFSLSLKSFPYTGRFAGVIILTSTKPTATDTIIVPIMLHVISDDDLVVSTAEPPSLHYVRHKCFSFILPAEYKQETIRIGLQNKSLYETELDACILSLRGTRTHHVVTPDNYAVSKERLSGQMPGEILVKIVGSLPADEYKGTLTVKKQPGLAVSEVPVTVKVRHGVFWPLFVMVAGMLFGFSARMVEGAKEIIALRNRLQFLAQKVTGLGEITGKEELLASITRAVSGIDDSLPGQNISKLTEQTELLEQQVENAILLDDYSSLIDRQITDEDVKQEANIKLQVLAKTNLYKIAEFEAVHTEFISYLGDIIVSKVKARGLVDATESIDIPVKRALSRPETKYSISNLITIKLVYGIFQPVVYFITVFLAVMAGFYEAYITKELTFGAGGVFDYIKLFIYGAGIVIVVREVFTTMLPAIKKQLGAN